jgi:hypothetical protein
MGRGEGGAGPARYRAFVSYSHRDAAFGRRLHRRLEGYRLPRRLVGRTTPMGPAPARLAPVFRDREELSAAGDLTAEVRAALAESAALVVVCSPAAAASPWVGREIKLFRELNPGRPILAALAEGEPSEAFPPALAGPGGAEPLAADFRREGDGARLALLKLVAGVLGLRLDELVQRDAQRRLAGVMAVTAASVAAMLAMGALTLFALASRAEAQRQRAQAEALVEFMLTDLRDRLKGVGRLDVMDSVNRRAAGYYSAQDLGALPVDSLERRARLLHAMGEDDLKRGDLAAASGKFGEANRTTAALLAADPKDPERIWAQAQSDYWVGYVDYQRGRRAEAGRSWSSYLGHAKTLAVQSPGNPKYLREVAYAEGNLCSLAIAEPPDAAAAVRDCGAALEGMERAAAAPGAPTGMQSDLANRHAWLAQAYRAAGDTPRSLTERLAEEEILAELLATDPKNMDLKERWVGLQRALAGLEFRAGRPADSRARLLRARAEITDMIAHDPANQVWAADKTEIEKNLAFVEKAASAKGESHVH